MESAKGSRFREEEVRANVTALLQEAKNNNTERTSKFALRILDEFLADTKKNVEVNQLQEDEAADILEGFFGSLKNTKGELYSRSSVVTIRAALRRYFLDSTSRVAHFDITSEPTFRGVNKVFKALLRKTRENGKGMVRHKPPIEKEDLKRLYEDPYLFKTNTPLGLVNKVFFETSLYFCRRGRENLDKLTPEHFQVASDARGKKFVKQVKTEREKNHQGDSDSANTNGGYMYATGGKYCPVSSFELYLEKRNAKCPAFFQRPLDSFSEDDTTWYCNCPMGLNTLSGMMKKFSERAGLSQLYTNHCIRATCITLLSEAQYSAKDITAISGHRNPASLDSYTKEPGAEKKSAMSDTLSLIRPSTSSYEGDSMPVYEDISDEELVMHERVAMEQFERTTASSSTAGIRSQISTRTTKQHPVFNISNCTVNINYN